MSRQLGRVRISHRYSERIRFFIFTVAALGCLAVVLPQPANAGTRVKTVEFFGGSYSGDGTSGRNTNTAFQLPAGTANHFEVNLAETGVDIKSAFLEMDFVYHAYTDYSGDHTGYTIAYDACTGACNPDPLAGTGRVTDDRTASISNYENESMHQKVLIDVTSEAQLAAYTGGGTALRYQTSYLVKNANTTSSVSNVRSKLIVTYEYDDTSANFTNTVIFPLSASYAGTSGSHRIARTKNCTKNLNCPVLTYFMNIPEFGTRVSNWFELQGVTDGGGVNDITHNVNINGTDTDSSNFIHEAALGGGQGNIFEFFVDSLAGVSENSSQVIEWYHDSAAATANMYVQGGEIHETYTAANSAGTKTRTVAFQAGSHMDDITGVGSTNAGVNVWFPETGVDVKSAWWRVTTAYTDGTAVNLDLSTTVGNNSETTPVSYLIDGPAVVVNPTVKIIQIIPAADYTELEAATEGAPKLVRLRQQTTSSNFGGISAELMITYTYTGQTEYQESVRVLGIPQSGIVTTVNNNSGPTLYFPKQGTQEAFSSRSLLTYGFSDSDLVMQAGTFLTAGDFEDSGGTLSCTGTYAIPVSDTNTFGEFWFAHVSGVVDEQDGSTYKMCSTHDQDGDSTANATMNAIFGYAYRYYPQPATPTVSAESLDRNPDLTSSAFSGSRTHTHTDWLVMESSASTCDDTSGLVVWKSLDNATNKTVVTVNTTTGTFQNALSGQTQLAAGTNYKACIRHNNGGSWAGDPDGGDSSWSTAVAFSTNNPPTASSALLQGGATVFTPNAGTTKTITGTATITDIDGCSTLVSPTTKFYRSGAGLAGADDDNLRYTMSCVQDGGSCTGGADTTATYTCTAEIQYFADSTDAVSPQPTQNWVMNITPNDTIGSGTAATDTIEMNSLVAASATSSVSYGLLALGANTGTTNQTISVENEGNVRLDLNLSAYAGTFGDGLSMSCSTGTVPVANEKYNKAAFNYATQGVAFTSAFVENDADLLKSTGSASTTTLYTGFGLPSSGVDGNCAGVISISPVHDTTND